MALVGETETPQDWSALARAVTDRRVELGHRTLRAFAEASGLSTKTLGEIEGAKRSSYDRATLIQVERSLKWPPGAVLAILEQGARVVNGVVNIGQTPAVDVRVALATPDDGTLDPRDPVERHLLLLKVWAPKLEPADRDRLLTSLAMTLEWLGSRVLTDEERRGPEGLMPAPSSREPVRPSHVSR